MLRKTNFLIISVLLSEIATFLTKKRSSLWISPKLLQNNRKTQFSCLWLNLRKIIFFLEFVPFYWFDQKVLFQKFLILLRIYPFKHVKKNKLSDYFSAPFEIGFFFNKKINSLWIFPRLIQNNIKALFSCMCLTLECKTVFVRVCPILLVWSKRVV